MTTNKLMETSEISRMNNLMYEIKEEIWKGDSSTERVRKVISEYRTLRKKFIDNEIDVSRWDFNVLTYTRLNFEVPI